DRLAVLLLDADDGVAGDGARGVAERLAAATAAPGLAEALGRAGLTVAFGVARTPDDLPAWTVPDRDKARLLIERATPAG
ncbi:MAG TPA: hypothetical protein VNM66_06645, partial [Thermodesulfobacteriota bacterium]|nr:hypothetical protein [Thermodesulfobacteriota bacterium]